MKTGKLITVATVLAIGIIAITPTGCKKDKVKGCTDPLSLTYNAEAEEDDGTCTYPTPGPGTSTTELKSLSVTTGPTMDGTIDASWANCQTLTGTTSVPNISDFTWFTGETYTFTLRSMHDATDIYFLAEWADPTESLTREGWYFDTTTNLWKQQNKIPTSATDKWYEDKFAMMWPTASTILTDWNASTCYSTCHGVTSPPYSTSNKHYMSTGEVNDFWHWKSVRTGNPFVNQFDDQKVIAIGDLANPTATEIKEGGRSSDAKTAGGYSDNKQTLTITGTSTSVTVPKYVIPGATNYYWITAADISSNTAVLITAVDANGVLTYATGTIDPALGGFEMNTGSKRAPSIVTDGPFVGSRGDISAFGKHNGTGWVLEYKRALTTTDLVNDIQFSTTQEYMFGIGIFERAGIAHGIKPNLKLKFYNS